MFRILNEIFLNGFIKLPIIFVKTSYKKSSFKVRIECNRTDYVCELDFKLKPFIGGAVNLITGDIKCRKELVAHIEGAWDGEIYISEKVRLIC